MHLTATFDNSVFYICYDFSEIICADMRLCVSQNRIGRAEFVERFYNVACFFIVYSSYKLSVRKSTPLMLSLPLLVIL